jgi:hypothetical protein
VFLAQAQRLAVVLAPVFLAVAQRFAVVLEPVFLAVAQRFSVLCVSLAVDDAESGRPGVGATYAEGRETQDQGDGRQAGFHRSSVPFSISAKRWGDAVTTHPALKG